MKRNVITIMAFAACLMGAPVAEAAVSGLSGIEMTTTPVKNKKKTTSKKSSSKKKITSKKTTTATTAATTVKADTSKTTADKTTTTSSSTGVGSLLGSILGAATGSSSSSSNSILSGLTSIFDANKQATANDLAGTWTYTEPAVVFTSDNVLKNVGGKVASAAIEKQLQSQFQKYGIKKGAMKMTFDKDGNFTQTLGGKTVSGTYTINKKQVVLSYGGTMKQIIGTTQVDGNDLLIVMDASKLLTYAKTLGALTGNSALQTAGSLLGSMDGMQVGLKLNK
jgi:hypothetical protein